MRKCPKKCIIFQIKCEFLPNDILDGVPRVLVICKSTLRKSGYQLPRTLMIDACYWLCYYLLSRKSHARSTRFSLPMRKLVNGDVPYDPYKVAWNGENS